MLLTVCFGGFRPGQAAAATEHTGLLIHVLGSILPESLEGNRSLPCLMPAVHTNGCELFMHCIGAEGFAPNLDCPECAGVDAAIPLDLPRDEELGDGKGRRWPGPSKQQGGAAWFVERLPYAYSVVDVHIRKAYQKWTADKQGGLPASPVTGSTIYGSIDDAVQTAWLDMWVGSRTTGPKHLAELLVHWLADELEAMEAGLTSKSKRRGSKCKSPSEATAKQAAMETRLLELGGVKMTPVFYKGQQVAARRLDKYGRISKAVEIVGGEEVRLDCDKDGRARFFPAVIEGPGISGHPGTWWVKYEDGFELHNAGGDKIVTAEPVKGAQVDASALEPPAVTPAADTGASAPPRLL
jgi:hypothetical protein